ncbi:MAG TPA: YihY/virulence factor BrkB family protein [Gemmatimonadaceae bacterium]
MSKRQPISFALAPEVGTTDTERPGPMLRTVCRVQRGIATVRGLVQSAITLDLPGEAAKMAYFFFLSLFPLVLALFAITGIVGGDAAFARIVAVAEIALPTSSWQFFRALTREITSRERPGLLSFGIALTLWTASSGVNALIRTLNAIYRVREPRPWWKRRGLAIAVLLIGVSLIVVGAATIVRTVNLLEGAGLGIAWRMAWRPLGFLTLSTTLFVAYQYLPARDQRAVKAETLAGGLIAAALWVGVTELFRLYLVNFGRFDRSYGAVGAVIVLLTWLYLTALVVLLGGDIAARIERWRAQRLDAPTEDTR